MTSKLDFPIIILIMIMIKITSKLGCPPAHGNYKAEPVPQLHYC